LTEIKIEGVLPRTVVFTIQATKVPNFKGRELTMNTVKSLTKEPPRSPRARLGGYALIARMIDKGRADLQGNAGEYHYACPLDQMLFEFKGVQADEVKKVLSSGATDEQVVTWFDSHGTAKTAEEIKAWSNGVVGYRPYDDPEKKGVVCRRMRQARAQARKLDFSGLSRGG
jgi:hypothetical protein